jgi:superfamily I DNA/RNA helicase
MKERIEKKIGKNNIPVNTFHSFALKVIKDNSKYFENRIGNPSSIKDVIINEDSLRRTK